MRKLGSFKWKTTGIFIGKGRGTQELPRKPLLCFASLSQRGVIIETLNMCYMNKKRSDDPANLT